MAYDNRSYWSSLHNSDAGEVTAVGYAALGLGFNRETYVIRLSRVREILGAYGVRPATVLEGAAGVGAYAKVWRDLGVSRWVGVDIAEAAMRLLQTRYPEAEFFAIDLANATAEQVSAMRGPFDLVTAIDVLYHLVEERSFAAALRTLASCVGEGGYLLVSDVFSSQKKQVAAHVLRRSLEAYESVLAPLGFSLVGRHPVFAILGDPMPRAGIHPVDHALFNTWRVTQKAIRSAPRRLRNPLGGYIARALKPVDTFLCRIGITRGVNLELALFRRVTTPSGGPPAS